MNTPSEQQPVQPGQDEALDSAPVTEAPGNPAGASEDEATPGEVPSEVEAAQAAPPAAPAVAAPADAGDAPDLSTQAPEGEAPAPPIPDAPASADAPDLSDLSPAEPPVADANAAEPAADESDEPPIADAPAAEPAADGAGEPAVAEVEHAPASGSEQVSMQELLMEEGDFLPSKSQRGDLVEGVVLRKDKDQLILDIGAKQEGVVPSSDVARVPADVFAAIQVGDRVHAVVIRPEGREGETLVSLYQARTVEDWDKAQVCLDSGEVLELEIVGYNKGGVLVGFGNLQGFVPRSHMARPASGPDDGADALAAMVGEKAAVKVIEVSRRKRRLIMSERLAMREWRSERKKRLLDQLREGDVRRGRISSVADFGAFVDLGGADGLVHVSEMTYERGKHPRDVVKVGQEVEVYVLSIDRDRKRIGLSMKRLQSDPWSSVEEDHYVGELVEALISNLSKFGAFARLDDGLEGLIHISELADHHVEHPREAVRPGQRLTVEIIAIEPERQRIGLSIRRVPPHLRTLVDAPPDEPHRGGSGRATGEQHEEAADAPPTEAEYDPAPGMPAEIDPPPPEDRVEADAAGDEAAADVAGDVGEQPEVAEPEVPEPEMPEPEVPEADLAEPEVPEADLAEAEVPEADVPPVPDDSGGEADEIAPADTPGDSEGADDSAAVS